MMPTYQVVLYDVNNANEIAANFKTDTPPPIKGDILCYDGIQWEVLLVRRNFYKEGTSAYKRNGAHFVHALVREIDDFYGHWAR